MGSWSIQEMDSFLQLVFFCFSFTLNPCLSASSTHRVIYHAGRTVAVADVDDNNDEIVSCRLETIKDDKDLQKVVLLQVNRRVESIKKISLDRMIKLISECAYMDVASEHPEARDFDQDSDLMKYLRNQFRAVHGSQIALYEGTRWCGPNNNARSYFDIGKLGDLDRCCRAHDYCPYFQQSFSLSNLTPLTKSACACDSAFFDCLLAVNSKDANKVGNIFFNSNAVKCVQLKHHFKCKDDECTSWEEDDSMEPEEVDSEIGKEYPYHPDNYKTSLQLDMELENIP